MTALRRVTTLVLVTALVAVPTTATATDEVTTDTRLTDETDRVTTDVPSDRPLLDEIKKRALEAIENKLEALRRLEGAIAGSRHITDGHAAQLLRDINAARDGLKELARKIEAATTREELAELLRHLDDWKIAQVLAPKTHQVIASDSLVAAARKLEAYANKLGNIITRFEEAGHEVGPAWRLLESMRAHIAATFRLADPVAESVIGLQPEDWPDPAEGILEQGRSDLATAGRNARAAHDDAAAIVHFLRRLIDPTTDLAAVDVAVTTDAAG